MIRAKVRGTIVTEYNNTIEIPHNEAVAMTAVGLINELSDRARADIAASVAVQFDLSKVQVTFEEVRTEDGR